jgi:hypothetical protein
MTLDVVKKAREFAAKVHKGQTDKNKDPYFNHLTAVAQGVRLLGGSLDEIAAAYLHDSVEDCKDVTFASLLAEGFPPEVVRIVWAVTKNSQEEQGKYLQRIVATGKGACRVKAADLLHNLRADRLAQQSEYTQERLKKKYQPSLARLLMELDYLQTVEQQKEQEKLATTPIGSSTGWSYSSTGSSSLLENVASWLDPNELLPTDWPAKASAPLLKPLNDEKTRWGLEDGTEWSTEGYKYKIRVWSSVKWKAKQANEKKKGRDWSPAEEWTSLTQETTKPVKEIASGKKKP